MSLKLGWYKAADADADGTFVHLRFVVEDAVNPSAVYQYNSQIFLEEMHRFSVFFEFVGVEKPDVWVPADPDKITLEMLPMRARFRDCEEQPWEEGTLARVDQDRYLDGNTGPCAVRFWKHCEVVQ